MKNIVICAAVLLAAAVGLWISFGDGGIPRGSEAGIEGLTLEDEVESELEPVVVGDLPLADPELDQGVVQTRAFEPEPEDSAPQVARPLVEEGIFGRVRRRGGEAVAFRKVKLAVIGSNGRRPFRTTTTDANGAYAISFPLMGTIEALAELSFEQIGGLRKLMKELQAIEGSEAADLLSSLQELASEPVWLEVSVEDSEGFRVSKRVELRPKMSTPIRANLLLRRVRDLEGEVLAGDGLAPRASVMLFDGDWNLVGTTRSDGRGRFSMNGPPPGAYRLHARLLGLGAGQIGGTFVGGAMRAPRQSVVLGGTMKLAGTVVTPDGDPVSGLHVTAIADSLAQTAENSLWPTPRELAQAESLGALCFSESHTDLKGMFMMGALEGGGYSLRFDNVQEQFQPRGLLITGQENRVVFSACMVVVELEGTAEQLLSTRVHLVETRGSLDPRGKGLRHFVQPSQLGGAQFVVEPGSAWKVHVERSGETQGEAFISTPEGTYLRELTTVLRPWRGRPSRPDSSVPPVDGLAKVEVVLKDGEGKSYTGLASLWVEEVSGRRMVVERQPLSESPIGGLAPGQYELRVQSLAGQTPFLPVGTERLFSLSPGRTKRIELIVQTGGWMQLEIGGSAVPENAVFSARLVPELEGVESTPLSFAKEGDSSVLSSTLRADQVARCVPVLEPGTYTLEIDCSTSSVKVPRQTVQIEGGKVLLVSVVAE